MVVVCRLLGGFLQSLFRKLEKKGIWVPICLLAALAIGAGAMSGCGGGGPIAAPVQNQTHQVHVSGSTFDTAEEAEEAARSMVLEHLLARGS